MPRSRIMHISGLEKYAYGLEKINNVFLIINEYSTLWKNLKNSHEGCFEIYIYIYISACL